jgi:hypothetical protein
VLGGATKKVGGEEKRRGEQGKGMKERDRGKNRRRKNKRRTGEHKQRRQAEQGGGAFFKQSKNPRRRKTQAVALVKHDSHD